MTLVNRFAEHMRRLGLRGPDQRALVAVSGGPDSVALLDLLIQTREVHGLDLIVAHVDHGIHPMSREIADRVLELARAYGLDSETGRLDLGPDASETLARTRRYESLEEMRGRAQADFILTAHHADDQAETVLMRTLAGSGPAGLAGMAPRQGAIVRPLLVFRRKELEGYVASRKLEAWTDPANADPRHLRSWLRSEVLPMLRSRVPNLDSNLERLAGQAAADRAAWDSVLDRLPGLDPHLEEGGISVAASPLADYDSALLQATILALARRVGCPVGPRRAERMFSLLRGASGSRVPLGDRWSAELSFGRLRIYRTESDCVPEPWLLQGAEGSGLWGRWQFRWEKGVAPARQERTGLSAWFTPEAMSIRGWSPGEKVKPLGGSGHRLIVRCFQDARVPRSRRGGWPVVAQREAVLWVPGVCRSDAMIPPPGTEALRVDAQYA